MKKIGILTYHASHNCGSMLQAYALQTVLKQRYDAEVEIINYTNKGAKNLYGILDLRIAKSAIVNNINRLSHLPIVIESRKNYQDFLHNHLVTTSNEYTRAEHLKELDGHYDIIIAGGDQVWNLKCPDADDVYYLGFADKSRKIAYSPSFGGNNINKVADNKEKYREWLRAFEKVSIREPNGQKWIQELTGMEVPIIADPTMLLTKEEWCSQFNLEKINEPFIFNYAFFHNRDEGNKAIQKISEITGLPVYTLDLKSWAFYRLDKYGIKRYKKTGPIAFLELMSQAELVLTQSFHGTLFASMFHKQFWSYRGPVIHSKDDDRAIAIMNQLGLSDRYQIIDELPQMDFMKKIDYAKTDLLIEELRQNAFAYLDSFM